MLQNDRVTGEFASGSKGYGGDQAQSYSQGVRGRVRCIQELMFGDFFSLQVAIPPSTIRKSESFFARTDAAVMLRA